MSIKNMLLYIIIASSIVGLIALIGVIFIFNKQINQGLLASLISLAAGSLLATALLDLLPEAIEYGSFDVHTIFLVVILSILFFFLTERIIHWHHCRCGDCDLTHRDK